MKTKIKACTSSWSRFGGYFTNQPLLIDIRIRQTCLTTQAVWRKAKRHIVALYIESGQFCSCGKRYKSLKR